MRFVPKGDNRKRYAQMWMGAPDSGIAIVDVENTDIGIWGCPWGMKDGNPCALNFAITCGMDAVIPSGTVYAVRSENGLSHLACDFELQPLESVE